MTRKLNFALLHGGGQGGWVWDETIAEIERQSDGAARCIALNAPGCGTKRDRETGEIAFGDIARELNADILAAGMDDVILVGHSQAGMELPQMAEFAPGLFRKLIFVTCSAPLPGVTTIEQMGGSRHGENADEVGWPVDPGNTTIEERFRAMLCNDMNEADANAFLAKVGQDMWPMCCYSYRDWRYDHLTDSAVTYVKCLQDQSLTPDWQDRFAQRLHADKVAEIDAGHQVMCTKPGELAELLLAESAP